MILTCKNRGSCYVQLCMIGYMFLKYKYYQISNINKFNLKKNKASSIRFSILRQKKSKNKQIIDSNIMLSFHIIHQFELSHSLSQLQLNFFSSYLIIINKEDLIISQCFLLILHRYTLIYDNKILYPIDNQCNVKKIGKFRETGL